MSWNNLPAWDKNRPIFFQIGMIAALSMANIAINYERLRPDYSDLVFEDDAMSLLMTDIKSHLEPPEPKRQNIIKRVNPLIAKIITTDKPVAEKIEYKEEIRENVIISDLTTDIGTNGTSIILPAKADPPVTPTLTMSEQMPYLATCDAGASEEERRKCTQATMLAYIYKNLKYPAIAREISVEGTVILSFVIDKNGKLHELEIIRDIGGGCGAAAAKVIKGLDHWVAGKHNRQAVNVKYTIPIKFKLER